MLYFSGKKNFVLMKESNQGHVLPSVVSEGVGV